jgi:hypothetical protein
MDNEGHYKDSAGIGRIDPTDATLNNDIRMQTKVSQLVANSSYALMIHLAEMACIAQKNSIIEKGAIEMLSCQLVNRAMLFSIGNIDNETGMEEMHTLFKIQCHKDIESIKAHLKKHNFHEISAHSLAEEINNRTNKDINKVIDIVYGTATQVQSGSEANTSQGE